MGVHLFLQPHCARVHLGMFYIRNINVEVEEKISECKQFMVREDPLGRLVQCIIHWRVELDHGCGGDQIRFLTSN